MSRKHYSEERKQEIRNAVKKELKALIFPLIVTGLLAAAIVFIINYQSAPKEEEIIEVRAYDGDGNDVVLENDSLKLTMDATTTNFDLTVKSSGKVWHSCAADGLNDPLAINEEKNKLMSPLILCYGTDAGLDTYYDTYSLSAVNGIYEIEQGEDYIRVDYSIGKVAKEFIIPPIIEASRLDELISTMSVTAWLIAPCERRCSLWRRAPSSNASAGLWRSTSWIRCLLCSGMSMTGTYSQ